MYLNNYILILKGFLIGIGKIMPGISGSLIAISLNVYEQSINAISNLNKKNILYLSFLGIGIIISITLMSKIIIFFINNYYYFTMSLFIGLLSGIIPKLILKEKIINKDWLFIIVVFLILMSSFFIKFDLYIFKNRIIDYIYIFILGIVESITMIIPGMSGTATYMLLGCYEFILSLFSNPFSCQFIIFFIGLIIGIFLISRLMNYFFINYRHKIYLFITSFTIFSIIYLIVNVIEKDGYSIYGIIIFILGFIISLILDR